MSNGWPLVPLGEVLTERQEIPSKEALANGEMRIIGKIGFNEGTIQLRVDGETKTDMILVRPGDLVVSGINATKGAIAVYGNTNTEPVAATIHYGAYIPNKERVSISYLWWLLRSSTFRELMLEYVPGGIKTELKAKRLLPIPIPLPPLAEQQRIVARIEALAARIAEARGLRQAAVEEAEALIPATLSRLSEDLLGSYSASRLESVTSFIGDMNHEMPSAVEDGIPLISPKDFGPNRTLNFANAKHISPEDFARLSQKCRPQYGDILLARYGTIGAARFVETEREFLASYSIAVIRPDSETIDGRFLYWMIISPYTQKQAVDGIRGSGMADLGLKTIKEFAIPLLAKDEQRRIVAYLDDLQARVDALRALQAATAAELDALLPAVLDKAFRGEL